MSMTMSEADQEVARLRAALEYAEGERDAARAGKEAFRAMANRHYQAMVRMRESLTAKEREARLLARRYEALVAACFRPDPEHTISGMVCNLCNADVSPEFPEMHSKECPLYGDAEVTP